MVSVTGLSDSVSIIYRPPSHIWNTAKYAALNNKHRNLFFSRNCSDQAINRIRKANIGQDNHLSRYTSTLVFVVFMLCLLVYDKCQRTLEVHERYCSRDKVLESELNTTIKGDYRGWLRLNVTGAAEKWTRNPGSNLGLFMKITGSRGKLCVFRQ